MDAPILKIIPQRHESDCSVACLAMVCGVSYENALVAIAPDEPNVCVKGVYTKQIQRAARRLGFSLRTKRICDLDNDTGILNVNAPTWKTSHLVVLRRGDIIDTDGTLYDADVYFATQHATAGSLYVLEPQ